MHHGKYNNADLPNGCLERNTWRRVLIPTIFSYLAACPDPWAQDDSVVASKLQLTWDTVYKDEPFVRHTILPSKAVFSVAAQHACEWRAGFGSSALTFLNAFFINNPRYDTDEARVTFAKERLENFKFLYEFAEGDDRNVRSTPRRPRTDHDPPVRNTVACFSVRLSLKHLPIISFPSLEPKTSQDSMITEVRPEVHSHSLLLA